MKKVILGLGLLLAVGGGCVAGGLGGQKTVEGDWFLAFDLPNGWVMVDDYTMPYDQVVTLDHEVDRTDNTIAIQNVDKPIVFSAGAAPDENLPKDSYVMGDATQIEVTQLDPSRRVPSEAEDLGDGFFKVELCKAGEDCMLGGSDNYDYYFVTDNAKYKFHITSQAQTDHDKQLDQAKDIIMSAKEVTVTDEVSE